MKENKYQYKVEIQGIRLDKFVSENVPDLSRTRAQKLIDEGLITVNGQPGRASQKLDYGSTVKITVPSPPPSELIAQEIPLKILYEDNDLMVVDKPAGMTVHPAAGHYDGTLVNAVLAHIPDIEIENTERPGIVHRLDKDTSGLIIVAKNPAAHMKLAGQFKEREVSKIYKALVNGHLSPETGIIDAAIGRDPRNRKRMAVTRNGRAAKTEYRVIKYIGNYTLLEAKPKTGRTHQIRVHLSAIGFPIVGDPVYGTKTEMLSRQFLHAYKLQFKLPSSGEYVSFESELPEDLKDALELAESKIRK
jgi:23S rRNA pseudouridine1911/1915/1917 synthase